MASGLEHLLSPTPKSDNKAPSLSGVSKADDKTNSDDKTSLPPDKIERAQKTKTDEKKQLSSQDQPKSIALAPQKEEEKWILFLVDTSSPSTPIPIGMDVQPTQLTLKKLRTTIAQQFQQDTKLDHLKQGNFRFCIPGTSPKDYEGCITLKQEDVLLVSVLMTPQKQITIVSSRTDIYTKLDAMTMRLDNQAIVLTILQQNQQDLEQKYNVLQLNYDALRKHSGTVLEYLKKVTESTSTTVDISYPTRGLRRKQISIKEDDD